MKKCPVFKTCLLLPNSLAAVNKRALLGAPGLTTRNKKLLVTSASLLVTSAFLVVTRTLRSGLLALLGSRSSALFSLVWFELRGAERLSINGLRR